MKGNIEGNATSFRFTEDMEEEDEFKAKMKTHRTMNHIPVYGPKSVPFSTAKADAVGFGAVARGIATPAVFNIPVDAEYDTDAGTIDRLYTNGEIYLCLHQIFAQRHTSFYPY
jgi:hypothetical protein